MPNNTTTTTSSFNIEEFTQEIGENITNTLLNLPPNNSR